MKLNIYFNHIENRCLTHRSSELKLLYFFLNSSLWYGVVERLDCLDLPEELLDDDEEDDEDDDEELE